MHGCTQSRDEDGTGLGDVRFLIRVSRDLVVARPAGGPGDHLARRPDRVMVTSRSPIWEAVAFVQSGTRIRAGHLVAFLYFYWSVFSFVSIRELFGMAGRPRSRTLRGGRFGGGPGVPRTLYAFL